MLVRFRHDFVSPSEECTTLPVHGAALTSRREAKEVGGICRVGPHALPVLDLPSKKHLIPVLFGHLDWRFRDIPATCFGVTPGLSFDLTVALLTTDDVV